MTHEILKQCRLCHGTELEPVLDLGTQPLSGVFPKTIEECSALERGPLTLVRCADPECNLVQLSATYDLNAMYGLNYGYRSGLNAGMVRHLKQVAERVQSYLGTGYQSGTWLDIGSNDGTLLGFVPEHMLRIGFDPTIVKFGHYYKDGIVKVPNFFTSSGFRRETEAGRADVVTSVACFYDLPDPVGFAKQIASILSRDGLWFSEQSYVRSMVSRLAFDTVCHEHLEYYGLKQVRRICSEAGLVVTDYGFNDVNGGSFWFVARPCAGPWQEHRDVLGRACWLEDIYLDKRAWGRFSESVHDRCYELYTTIRDLVDDDYTLHGLGASTKGNVLLNYCGLGPDLIEKIAEVNPDKFGCFTPNGIPIVSEGESFLDKPDFYLVLPWHFRTGFERAKAEGAFGSTKLIFPLPELEIVG